MDEDTKAKAERKDLVEGDYTFAAVCDFLEILTNDGENKKTIADYAELQAPGRMDLSALAAGGSPPEAALAAESPPPRARGFIIGCIWQPAEVLQMRRRRASASRLSEPGGGRGPVHCKGWGHYAAECRSKEAKGKGKG